ncbi:radical SAM protein [candidate division WOR-3 bacterium]|nr:radical SAM protein [candidate division WOR-3 bacterium]
MQYLGTVIRPPSEAESYILQVTYGCSHNKCTFCPTYLDKSFRVRPVNEVMGDIEIAQNLMPQTRRVFLADGNALVLSNQKLMPILDTLNSSFPGLQRVGIYANAGDILRKTDQELKELSAKKLLIIYIGLESGSNRVLKKVNKGATAEEMIEAVNKAQNAGFKVSVIGLLGLGGTDLWKEHAVATGKAVSAMNPLYFSLLTLMIVPGTELYRQWEEKEFILSEPLDMLREMRVVIENINVSSGCIFRTNHASNYLSLAGRLPNDKERLLKVIDQALAEGESRLRPEFLRGL